MRRVLYLVLEYPPINGPGVWRGLAFSKYLPRFGWLPTVLCSDRAAARDRFDEALNAEIPPEIEVQRVSSILYRDVKALSDRVGKHVGSKLLKRRYKQLRSWLLNRYPDQQIHWALKVAWKAILELRSKPYEVIISSGPPHVVHLAGLIANAVTGTPWFIDYRDPWSNDKNGIFQMSYQQEFFEELERLCVRRCTGVLSVTETYIEDLRARFPEEKPESGYHCIRNGHDLSEAMQEAALTSPQNDRLWIHFNGTPQTTQQPFQKMLDALAILREQGDVDLPKLSFSGIPPELPKHIESLQLEAHVVNVGFQSRENSQKLCTQADVLLVMLSDHNPAWRGAVPAKFYEAIGLGRFTWVVQQADSELERLMNRYQAELPGPSTEFSWVGDTREIAQSMRKLTQLHRQGLLNPPELVKLRQEQAKPYSREVEAEQLAAMLNQVLA